MSATDYLSRLALALPLVLVLAIAALFAVRRGWLKLPMRRPGDTILRATATLALAPGVRLIAVNYAGKSVLLAVSKAGINQIDVTP